MMFSITVNAADLSGMAHVDITSDTAANAKNMAMGEARRQIIKDVLSRYADAGAVRGLVSDTKDAQLTNLISTTGIEAERLSATSYSADIKMTLDAAAVTRWLGDNNIVNSLGTDAVDMDTFTTDVHITGGLYEWIGLQSAMRNAKITPQIRRIAGQTITMSVPQNQRAKFSAVLIAHSSNQF